MTKGFTDKLTATIAENDSLLCVGLDPDLLRIPANFLPDALDVERIKAFCLDIIEKTAEIPRQIQPLQQIRDDIRNLLLAKKRQSLFNEFLKRINAQAEVDIYTIPK